MEVLAGGGRVDDVPVDVVAVDLALLRVAHLQKIESNSKLYFGPGINTPNTLGALV